MIYRPFQFGVRPLPNGAEDSPESLAALLAECQAELEAVDVLSPLRLSEMEGEGRGEMNRLKERYWGEGRYGEEFLKRRSDLSVYLYAMYKPLKVDKALRRRGLGQLWNAFKEVEYQIDELDPVVLDGLGGGSGKPDNISDGLSQGIGVREVL